MKNQRKKKLKTSPLNLSLRNTYFINILITFDMSSSGHLGLFFK